MKYLRFNHIAISVKLSLVAMVLVLLSSVGARAADVKIIANSSVASNSISVGEIKDVFLLDKDSLRGSHVEPVLTKGDT